ncbi:endo alpha-1,4 polygalactosaminidase [Actinoplanes sp. NPDC049548]|uniref:endo alpha-1,4 polygalactosaminidase n=1 Tax=Actinoplanes sp. NPDC049548 TaxID=3155152 RepID=UPI00342DC15B
MVTRTVFAVGTALAAAVATTVFALHADAASVPAAEAGFTLPPANAAFDYQIGGAYAPPSGVTVVSRDREAPVAAGIYTICYVNAYQTQPGEAAWWQAEHDDLLLRDDNGEYVVDGEWDEILLDISTPEKRTAVAAVVNGWIDGCARDGFRAVEPDNIDSYDRSGGKLDIEDSVAYLTLLAPHAHAAGLAIGQKNTTDLGTRGRDLGLDFAITEDCGRWDECTDYTDVYGDHVIDVEYSDSTFRKACRAVGATVSVVRRDLKVTAPGSGTYKYDAC